MYNVYEKIRKETKKGLKEDFIKSRFITCKYCGYNNDKQRLRQYGTCLKCGKVLDEKLYFMIRMQKLIKNNERKMH